MSEFGIREGLIESLVSAFFTVLTLKDIDATHPNPNRLKVELRPGDLSLHKEIAVVKITVPLRETETGVLEEVEPIEDRALLINPTNEEYSVFVIHQVAQKLLRNELTYWIKTVRAYETIDLEHLRNTLKAKASAKEEKLLSLLAKDLPIFDYQV